MRLFMSRLSSAGRQRHPPKLGQRGSSPRSRQDNTGRRPSLFGGDHRYAYTKPPGWAWRHAPRNLPTNFPEEPYLL